MTIVDMANQECVGMRGRNLSGLYFRVADKINDGLKGCGVTDVIVDSKRGDYVVNVYLNDDSRWKIGSLKIKYRHGTMQLETDVYDRSLKKRVHSVREVFCLYVDDIYVYNEGTEKCLLEPVKKIGEKAKSHISTVSKTIDNTVA